MIIAPQKIFLKHEKKNSECKAFSFKRYAFRLMSFFLEYNYKTHAKTIIIDRKLAGSQVLGIRLAK